MQYFVCLLKSELSPVQIPQLPNPPPDVERNPTLLAEYESIAGQIKSSCHQVALLDRVHNIKVCFCLTFDPSQELNSPFNFLVQLRALHKKSVYTASTTRQPPCEL